MQLNNVSTLSTIFNNSGLAPVSQMLDNLNSIGIHTLTDIVKLQEFQFISGFMQHFNIPYLNETIATLTALNITSFTDFAKLINLANLKNISATLNLTPVSMLLDVMIAMNIKFVY